MKKILRYLKPYAGFALLAPLLMIIEVIMDLLQPQLIAQIIDTGIANTDWSYVYRTGLLMVGIAIIGIIGGLSCTIFSAISAVNMGADIRKDLFKKIHSLSFKNIDQFETGNLITILTNDVLQVQQVVMMGLRILVRAPLLAVGSIVMAVLISPRLSLIITIICPLLVIGIIIILKKSYPLFSRIQEKLDNINTVLKENLSGIRVIKAFVRADFEKKKFAAVNNDFMEASIKATRLMAVLSPFLMIVLNVGLVSVLWFGGLLKTKGFINAGEIIAFINYLLRLLFSLMILSFLLMRVSRAKVSADRITALLESCPVIIEENDALSNLQLKGNIQFQNVFFKYNPAGEPVLKNINIDICSGETIAIMGSTGSGKSSLLHLIPRFYEPVKGTIKIDGIDIRRIKQETLRNNISFVMQNTILFSGSIEDNIKYSNPQADSEDIKKAAQLAQADEFITHFPDQYASGLGQRGVNLSGGQKQRLAIARAFCRKAPILILDDCTSSVDVLTEIEILNTIFSQKTGITCLIVTQKIATAIKADRIMVLDDGEIKACGTHKDLMKNSDIYKEIYASQIQ